MSDFHNSDVGFSQLGCRIFNKSDVGISASRMSDFHNSDVGFSTTRMSDFHNSDVGFLQLGCRISQLCCRIFTSRMSDFHNFVVEFSTTRMAPTSFRRHAHKSRAPFSRNCTRIFISARSTCCYLNHVCYRYIAMMKA